MASSSRFFDDDDDDDDIFIIQEIKPKVNGKTHPKLTRKECVRIRKDVLAKEENNPVVVLEVKPLPGNQLTIQQGLLIKNSVLNDLDKKCYSDKQDAVKRKSKKESKTQEILTSVSSPKNRSNNKGSNRKRKSDKELKTPEKNTQSISSPGSSSKKKKVEDVKPGQKITKFFTPVKSSPGDSNSRVLDVCQKTQTEFTLKVRKDIFETQKSSETCPVPSTSKAKLLPPSSKELESAPESISTEVTDRSVDIFSVMLKEVCSLQSEQLKNSDSSLFEKTELDTVLKFSQLDVDAKTLFVRMFFRKKIWHRVSKINKYQDISPNISEVFDRLCASDFLDCDIIDQGLDVILNMLSCGELKKLCKTMRLPDTGKKEDMIQQLISNKQKQKSVKDMYGKKNSTVNNFLRSEAVKILGMCVKLNVDIVEIFNKFILLFSLVHDNDDEEKRARNQYFMLLQVQTGALRFPNFNICRTTIFPDRQHFLDYYKANWIMHEFDVAMTNKDHDEFRSLAMIAWVEFGKIMENKPYRIQVAQLLPFLKRYNAGSIYAKILTRFCENMKRKSDKKENMEILKILLGQTLYLKSARGNWYELLYDIQLAMNNTVEAVRTMMMALTDELVCPVSRLAFQIKAQTLLKKKTNGIKDRDVLGKLGEIASERVKEPKSVFIDGKALDTSVPGRRMTYIQRTSSGVQYSTVEEHAIMYYKKNGFTDGLHTEGAIIKSIYFLLFWDIVYELSPPGVFQSYYQERPLDLNYACFYESRKLQIDKRIKDLKKWEDEVLFDRIRTTYDNNVNTKSLVSWNDTWTCDVLCDIILCIGRRVLIKIFKRLIHHHAIARAGFPDLLVWNVDKRRCKFVEVKSPNDRLSCKQRLWLDYLAKSGADCEVCNVKITSSKRLSRAESEEV